MTPETITRLLKHRDAEWWPEGLEYTKGQMWIICSLTVVTKPTAYISHDLAETILIGAMVQQTIEHGTTKQRLLLVRIVTEGCLSVQRLLDAVNAHLRGL